MKVKKIKKSKGMTLLEVTVAVCLFTVASALSASFIIYGYKRHLKITEEALATDRVNVNIQKMLEELRKTRDGENAAYAIESALANEIIFYSDIDSNGETDKVSYYLDGSSLYKGIIAPVGNPATYPAENEETIEITDKIINDEDEPIFRYFGLDAQGEGSNPELTHPINIAEIRLIWVQLKTPVGNTEKERLVESRVLLRNLKDN